MLTIDEHNAETTQNKVPTAVGQQEPEIVVDHDPSIIYVSLLSAHNNDFLPARPKTFLEPSSKRQSSNLLSRFSRRRLELAAGSLKYEIETNQQELELRSEGRKM